MIAVYPIGIPMLFAFLLLNRRDKINPLAATEHPSRAVPLDRPVRPSPERQRGVTVPRAVPMTGFSLSVTSSAAVRAKGYGEEEIRPVAAMGRESQGVRVREASVGSCAPTHQEV